MKRNYPKKRKSVSPHLHEPKFKCPECDFVSREGIVRYHYERWHVLREIRKLIFSNPCIGCKNLHKPISKLTVGEYQKLCLLHADIYNNHFTIPGESS